MANTARNFNGDNFKFKKIAKRGAESSERISHRFHFRFARAANGNDHFLHLDVSETCHSFQSCVCFSRAKRAARNSFNCSIVENTWSEQPSIQPLICSTGNGVTRYTGIPFRCATVSSAGVPPLCAPAESQ